MAVPTAESLQALVLSTLDSWSSGSIDDSRELQSSDGSKLGPGEAQAVLKGVLDSLLSREVSPQMLLSCSASAKREADRGR
jgi:hypothetical protein